MNDFVLYLDVRRAAEAVSMSPRWIRKEIVAGLPVLRTEGKILICPDTLKKWMASRYTPTPVDLGAAFEMASTLAGTRGRRRGKAAR